MGFSAASKAPRLAGMVLSPLKKKKLYAKIPEKPNNSNNGN
jgi:hypothetical protein